MDKQWVIDTATGFAARLIYKLVAALGVANTVQPTVVNSTASALVTLAVGVVEIAASYYQHQKAQQQQ